MRAYSFRADCHAKHFLRWERNSQFLAYGGNWEIEREIRIIHVGPIDIVAGEIYY